MVSAKPAEATAPPGLVAEAVLVKPQAFWQNVRSLLGPKAAFLPLNPAVGLARALGLPLLSAGSLELEAPLKGLLLEGDKGLQFLIALPVRSGRELVAQMSAGKAPPFRVSSSADGLTELVPNEPRPLGAVAVLGNTLVVGTAPISVGARYLLDRKTVVGPNAARSAAGALQIRASERELKGPVSKVLQRWWVGYQAELGASQEKARRVRAGRAPDFGDPAVVVSALGAGVEAVLAVLDSSREARLELVPGTGVWTLDLELAPLSEGAAYDLVSEQVTGSLEPLSRLPANTALGIMSRSTLEQRVKAAGDVALQLKALAGARVSADEYANLEAGLAHFARGRGDVSVLGLTLGETPGLSLDGKASDPEALRAAFEALPKLIQSKALAEPLANFFGKLKLTPVSDRLGAQKLEGFRLTFGAQGHLGQLAGSGVELLWQVGDQQFQLALAKAPAKHLLEALRAPEPESAAETELRARLSSIDSASLAILARPALFGLVAEPPTQKASSTLLLGAGRRGKNGFLKFLVPEELCQAWVLATMAP